LFFGLVQGNGGHVIFVSLPDVLIGDFSFSSEIQRLEEPRVFDELSEILIFLFSFEGLIEDSVNDLSWGIFEGRIFLDGVSSKVVSGSVSHVGFVFSHFFFGIFG